VETPDELDMLVTSKNHDLKTAVTSSATINDWLFALITLQTTEGFGGAGNYGISRMNGGLGCRPAFTLAPAVRPEIHTVRPGIHVRRDLGALLECREELLNEYPMYPRDGGVQLLWTKPWDGTKVEAFSPKDLDLFYIEACRRIRLQADRGGTVSALRATSKAARIEAKALKGVTGDPWTPINTKESKSLTLPGGGFTYKKTVDYLFGKDWEVPPLFKPTAAEESSPQDMLLVARGMVRGQGKTEGYHERIVPFKEKAFRVMGRPAAMQELGDIARQRIEEVGKVQRILRHAVSVFAAGGSTDSVSDEHRSRANPWANKLDEIVDTTFFDELQTEFEADDPGRRKQIRNYWLKNNDQDGVIDQAWQILRAAEESLPCPAIQRYRARVRADSVFNSRIRGPKDGFPDLYDYKGEVTSDN
ncbi:MAG: type I-E CRISPR-associated protein Cse1/CasA, partial [Chloroflexota bacterium]|nr:type I-E CRISPR-associated protein Cse1/CasA [Chloroflexota bacterium]